MSFFDDSRPQTRILSVVAAAELAVGGFRRDDLSSRLADLCGVDSFSASNGVAAGQALLNALGMEALAIDPECAAAIVERLESHRSGSVAIWVRSLEDRGGATPGTRLSLLVSVLRKADRPEAPAVTPGRSVESRAAFSEGDRASARADVRDEVPRDLESPSHRVRQAPAFDSAHEPHEPDLTFDDDFSGLGSDELIPRADDDLGLGGPIDLSDDPDGDADLGH